MVKTDPIHLREANEEDCRFVWEVNNHPAVRAQSISTDPIAWDDHAAWFTRTLSRLDRRLYVGWVGRERIGVVRFDRAAEPDDWVVSIALASEKRGRGLGAALLRASREAMARRDARGIVAFIRPDNTPSLRAFTAAGYACVGRAETDGVQLLRYETLLSPRRRLPVCSSFAIGGREIGPGRPAYIIAEMSANHDQNIEKAKAIIRAAKNAGADAVKLQTYTPDTITIDVDADPFRIGEGTLWTGRTLYALYGEAYTPWEWHGELKALANSLGMDLFSSPFDHTAVDFLEELDVPAYKIASFEIVDIPLIRRVAQTKKPTIMSTGMATLAEIEEAVQAFREAGGEELVLLKCTSAYPAPAEDANLRTIAHLAETFGAPAGLSDHTMGIGVPIAAVALGACVIEKHFTLSRDEPGPDSAFSLEPAEFEAMVKAVRTVEEALGEVSYELTEKQRASTVFRRSLFVVEDVEEGEELTPSNVRSIRPGDGLHTRHYEEVLGRKAGRRLTRGTPLSWEHLRPETRSDDAQG